MTDYRITNAGIEHPTEYGRQTGERYVALRLQVGKREKLEMLRLTEAEALLLAEQLLTAVRRVRT